MDTNLLLSLLPPPLVEPSVTVGTCTLLDLLSFQESYTIEIPDYQRPYVWNAEKVRELIKDLSSYYSERRTGEKYYMGSLLFYQKPGERYDIIDGQQRITTLLILDHVLNGEESALTQHGEYLNLHFNSPRSKENITRNHRFLQEKMGDSKLTEHKKLLQDLVVTTIVTDSQDDAFTFFDTQNNRGVKLSAIDFLKSFHLRELKGQEDKQRLFARKWDSNNQNQFLDGLFNQIIWRSRRWKGKTVYYENRDLILEEFQKRTEGGKPDGSITLYPGSRNRLALSLAFDAISGASLQSAPISLQTTPVGYPFSLRQPLERGTGFFLFTEKYASLYKHIFFIKQNESELYKAVAFYRTVYSNVSEYLKALFEVSMVMYFDKFEEEKIYEFSLWLDFLLGTYRINQKSIVAQTPVKILRDNEYNLLDVIAGAYLPEEVFRFLRKTTNEEIYANEIIPSWKGVQGSYKGQVKKYFGKSEEQSLKDKKKWIYDYIDIK